MKKVLKMLFVLMMLIPFVAKADMGAPELRSYEVEVVKEKIEYYEHEENGLKKKGEFEKGTKLKVIWEETIKGEDYLSVEIKNPDEYGLLVKTSDVVPLKEEVSYTDSGVDKLDKKAKYRVYADEVEVRKGPSKSYKVVGVLKKGTTGEYQYNIIGSAYIYVEADGVKGWVDGLGRSVLTRNDDSKYVVGKRLDTSCGTIPVNTVISGSWEAPIWDNLSNKDGASLISYKGCETFIPTFKSQYVANYFENKPGDGQKVIVQEVKVYEDADLKKVVGTLPAYTIPEAIGENTLVGPSVSYVQYKNIKGWIDDMPNDKFSMEFVKDVKMPEQPKEEPKEEEPKEEEPKEEEPKEEEKKEDKKDEKKEDKKDKKKMDTRTLGIICVVVGLALALAGVTTIVLINKNKTKAKPTSEKEEAPEKEEASEEKSSKEE